MALTVRKPDPRTDSVWGNLKVKFRLIDFDSSYAAGGESLAPRDFDLRHIAHISIAPKVGFTFEWDRATKKLKAFARSVANTSIKIEDNDSAASQGVAAYVHVDEVLEQGSTLAHLEFVSPTNADGTGTLTDGGPTYYIQDDDNAASGGAALYFDEDAALGSRLLANCGRDCFVNVGSGRFVKITHHATPGTPGVQVYFDEDAANTYERLRFVSPTNTDGSDTTSGEVASAINLASLTDVEVMAVGTGG